MKAVFLELLKTSILISILIGIIILCKDKILSKYSHKVNYFLSIVVIIRMIFITRIKIDIPTESKVFTYNEGIKTLSENLTKVSQSNYNDFDYMRLIASLWVVGVMLVLLYYAYFQGIFYFKIRKNSQAFEDKYLQSHLNEEAKALGIKTNIKVMVVKGIPTPSLMRIFKNTIIIPEKKYSKRELKWIFKHELTHFKRKDNLLKLLMIFAVALHFFNPLVYLFRKFFNEQCELSCDEQVIKNSKVDEVKEYALLLVNSVRYKNNLAMSALSSQLTSKKINIMKRRIDNMLNLKAKKKGIALGALTLLIAGGTLFAVNTSNALADTPEDHVNDKAQLQQELKDTLEESAIKGDTVKTEINGVVTYTKSGSFK